MHSILDSGQVPVDQLALLALREAQRPRAIYQAHRWFARRFGSVFRALLLASSLPEGSDFWYAYYRGMDLANKVVLDPFVGGGTSVVEAQRLGASVIGIDIDPIACAITQFELHATHIPELTTALSELKETVGKRLARYYRTCNAQGESLVVLHYFWVQVVRCRECRSLIEAHSNHQLAYDAEGTSQWAFCPGCHSIQELPRSETHFRCQSCSLQVSINEGVVYYGRITCPGCGETDRLIEVARRTKAPPVWRMFALEAIESPVSRRPVALKNRRFLPVRELDQATFEKAKEALRRRIGTDGAITGIPKSRIPVVGRADDRLPSYGYRYYHQLFNPRQLLHLSLLAEAVAGLDSEIRGAFALAMSDHLTTNCMLTHYAAGWRRLAPLFSVRAFRHVTRPVEINPWLDGTGRGTFPNAVRQVQRAVEYASNPKEALVAGGFCAVPNTRTIEPDTPPAIVHNIDARKLGRSLAKSSVDLVLTDPPYFDNIAYSELSDFFRPWLEQQGVIDHQKQVKLMWSASLAGRARDQQSLDEFRRGLTACMKQVARVLKPAGRLVFTFQHVMPEAWLALGHALDRGGFCVIQVFPVLGDGSASLHTHEGSIRWDAVFVTRKRARQARLPRLSVSKRALAAADTHWRSWVSRLPQLQAADRANFYRACLVAASLGMFSRRGPATSAILLSTRVHNTSPDTQG